jgi:hypothetical protein
MFHNTLLLFFGPAQAGPFDRGILDKKDLLGRVKKKESKYYIMRERERERESKNRAKFGSFGINLEKICNFFPGPGSWRNHSTQRGKHTSKRRAGFIRKNIYRNGAQRRRRRAKEG